MFKNFETGAKKIGINASFFHDQPTGLAVYTYEVVKELLKILENDVIIYTSSPSLKIKFPDKVFLITSLTSPRKKMLGHLVRFFWEQSILPFSYLKNKLSFIYNPIPEGILFPYFNQIVTVHDIIPLLYSEIHPKMKYYYRFILPRLLKFAKFIICVSENTKKDLLKYYNTVKDKEIYVVYEGCRFNSIHYDSYFVRRRYNIEKYIFYVGDMRPYKNLERAIEAFSKLPLNDFYFVIGGKKDRNFYPKIQEKVKRLNLNRRVIFTDYIKEEELPFFYKEASLFIFPSLYEGFGLPPLEAMASGCPVVVSNVASLPEVCGDAAYYIDPYDINSISEGIYKVLTDKNLRMTLIQKGFERVKLFTWEKTARQIIEIFERTFRNESGFGT